MILGTLGYKRLDGAVEDAVEIGQCETVVGYRYTGCNGRRKARGQLFGSNHTAATLDNKGIVRQWFFKSREARHDIERKTLASDLGQKAWKFHTSYVLAGDVMGA